MWSLYNFSSWGWSQLTGIKDEANFSKAGRQNETKKSYVARLPPELLEGIFQLLSLRDLKSVVQVCQLWKEEGERPRLWALGVVRVTKENLSNMPEGLATRRMLMVRHLRDWESVSGELLEAVMRHRWLKRLDLRSVTLSSLEPGLLARAATGMDEMQLGYGWGSVSSQQA